MSYNAKLAKTADGKVLVDGVQTAAIVDIATVSGDLTNAERVKFNLVLAALRAAGIIAA
jgi:hypothetical protein